MHLVPSRVGRGRADLKHTWIDPLIVGAPWLLAGGLGFAAARAVKRRAEQAETEHGSEVRVVGAADGIVVAASDQHETIDLGVAGKSLSNRDEILGLRNTQRPGQGLLLLYPIEPESRTDTQGRRPLNAPTDDVVIGVALVFPRPLPGTSDSDVEYWSADLSGVAVEEEDLSVLDQDDEAA